MRKQTSLMLLVAALVSIVAAASACISARSQWLVEETRIDPIMALSGTDPEALLVSVETLRRAATALTQYYKSPSDRHVLEESLVPYRSLTAAAELETARLAFLQHPNLFSTLRYLVRLEYALHASERDSRALIRNSESFHRSGSFALIDGTISYADIHQNLSSFVHSVHDRRIEHWRRVGCLFAVHECDHSVIPQSLLSTTSNIHPLTSRESKLLAVISEMDDAQSDVLGYEDKLIFMHTPCSFTPQSYVLTTYRTNAFDKVTRKNTALSEIILYDYSNDVLTDPSRTRERAHLLQSPRPLVTWFRANNVLLSYQSSSNFYFCFRSGEQVSRASAILGLEKDLESLRSRTDVPLSSSTTKIIDEFLADSTLQESRAARVLDELKQEIISSPLLSLENKNELSEIVLRGRIGTFRFNEVVNAAAQHYEFSIALAEQGYTSPPEVFLLTRSFPTVLLMMANSSLSPTPLPLRPTDLATLDSLGATSFALMVQRLPERDVLRRLFDFITFSNDFYASVRPILRAH